MMDFSLHVHIGQCFASDLIVLPTVPIGKLKQGLRPKTSTWFCRDDDS